MMNLMTSTFEIRHDGSNLICHQKTKRDDTFRKAHNYGPFKEEYEDLYNEAINKVGKYQGYFSKKELPKAVEYIYKTMEKRHPVEVGCGLITKDLVEKNVFRVYHLMLRRYVTLKRKVQNNPWNWFITFTYSDKLFESAQDFEDKILNCLSHLSSNRGWRYFAKFENGEKGGRHHLHVVAYIPPGQMVGKLELKGNYNKKKGKYLYTSVNDFFLKNYGWNEFRPVNQVKLRSGGFKYLTKYMSKDGGKFIYSRGVPPRVGDDVTLSEEDFLRFSEDEIAHFYRYGTFFILDPSVFRFDPFTDSFFEYEYIEKFDEDVS